jgi:hypothetical protein
MINLTIDENIIQHSSDGWDWNNILTISENITNHSILSILQENQEDEKEEEDICCICLEILTENNRTTLHCNHTLHTNCFIQLINTSINSNCPLCRSDIIQREIIQPVNNVIRYGQGSHFIYRPQYRIDNDLPNGFIGTGELREEVLSDSDSSDDSSDDENTQPPVFLPPVNPLPIRNVNRRRGIRNQHNIRWTILHTLHNNPLPNLTRLQLRNQISTDTTYSSNYVNNGISRLINESLIYNDSGIIRLLPNGIILATMPNQE